MKRQLTNLSHIFGLSDERRIRILLAVGALALFALSAGAPAIHGG